MLVSLRGSRKSSKKRERSLDNKRKKDWKNCVVSVLIKAVKTREKTSTAFLETVVSRYETFGSISGTRTRTSFSRITFFFQIRFFQGAKETPNLTSVTRSEMGKK